MLVAMFRSGSRPSGMHCAGTTPTADVALRIVVFYWGTAQAAGILCQGIRAATAAALGLGALWEGHPACEPAE